MSDRDEVVDNGEVQGEEEGSIANDGLPMYVRINPENGGMWYDDISGLLVSAIEGTTDKFGNPIRNFTKIPVNSDCSRIKDALRRGILVPCDPSGTSKLIKERKLVSYDSIEKLMDRRQMEVISIVNNITDAELLSKMRTYEEGKKKGRRLAVLQAIVDRTNSRDVVGVTVVRESPSMVYDSKSGRLVPDVIKGK
jgi:hypothetical protein